MKIRIGTFNCENLFLRYSFAGPTAKRKAGESSQAYSQRRLAARKDALAEFASKGVSLDWMTPQLDNFSAISHTQRAATAAVITKNDPDIIAPIEIENMEALRKFNSTTYFKSKRYRHFMVIDGNDPRGIDVAVLSRYPLVHLRSYITDTYKSSGGKDVPTFSRDCLVVRVEIAGKPLTLFINHLKSQYQDDPERRKKQAARVASIVEETFGSAIDTERFAVVGDFNQIPTHASLQPLLTKTWHTEAVGLLPAAQRWTHAYEKGDRVQSVNQLDYILLSKPLAANLVGKPIIERRGLARYKGLDRFFADAEPRFPNVDKPGTEASDHCAVFVDMNL